MRLDKLLNECGLATRSEASKLIRKGGVTVNGVPAKSGSDPVDPEKDAVVFCGRPVEYRKFTYILMNKPEGTVSSTDGKDGDTVISLLPPELRKIGLFPCGRLDKDTVGCLLLTNDGSLSHFLLSPKRHVDKKYFVRCEKYVSDSDLALLSGGLDIGNGEKTAKTDVMRISEKEFEITLREGMYHQIKRMVERTGNSVVFLERTSFAFLTSEPPLGRGEWRYLTPEEEERLKRYDKNTNGR